MGQEPRIGSQQCQLMNIIGHNDSGLLERQASPRVWAAEDPQGTTQATGTETSESQLLSQETLRTSLSLRLLSCKMGIRARGTSLVSDSFRHHPDRGLLPASISGSLSAQNYMSKYRKVFSRRWAFPCFQASYSYSWENNSRPRLTL